MCIRDRFDVIADGDEPFSEAMRISGFVNAAKRVLNVDQAAVLVLDETAGSVELNKELLARQFRVTVR